MAKGTGTLRGVMVSRNKLFPHPDNPRKNLGDLTELAESIRKNGIMQNLTVIPKDEDEGTYTILIGHRRAAAAEEAGVAALPCNVVYDLSPREQLGIMLEENMQRTDLTVLEQAQGFQMMLDLGETEESIAEKTGFSKTTIRHRLQIAKLDPKAIKRQTDKSGEFQLSITDLIALEDVKDMKTRNEILMNARDGRDLRQKVEIEKERRQRRDIADAYIKELEAMGIPKAPKKVEDKRWSINYDTIGHIDLDEPKKDKSIKDIEKKLKKGLNAWYIDIGPFDRFLTVLQSNPKGKEAEKLKTAAEKKAEEKEAKKKKLEKIFVEYRAQRKTFVLGILDGKYKCDDTARAWEKITEAAIALTVRMYEERIGEYLTGKQSYHQTDEQKAMAAEKLAGMDPLEKIVVLTAMAAHDAHDVIWYTGEFYKPGAEAQKMLDDALALWGYAITEPEIIAMIEGTAEEYAGVRS